MLGKEVADVVVPILIVGGAFAAVGIIAYKVKQGIIAKDDLKEVGDATRKHNEASEEIAGNRRRLRDLFNRTRVPNNPDS